MPSELKVQDGGWGVTPSAAVIPGDPVFSSSRPPTIYDSSVEGEALRAIGSLSGPPPPGFIPGRGDKSRVDHNSSALWNDNNSVARGEHSRTSSFNNLAAALGKGLAESMDDATNGEHTKAMLTDSFLFNAKDDISYARHSRHAAARLLGAGQPKDAFGSSHKGPEAGSLFAAFDSGERGQIKRASGLRRNFSQTTPRSVNRLESIMVQASHRPSPEIPLVAVHRADTTLTSRTQLLKTQGYQQPRI
jgi:hypothetical protein